MSAQLAPVRLFRAVMSAERNQIEETGTLENVPGIEIKYFATTEVGASRYAQKAYGRFGELEPYDIIEVEVDLSLLEERITVDRDIETVVLDSKQLIGLAPKILRYCLIGGL